MISSANLAPGGLHHVLGLPQLPPHSGHLQHQPSVVSLSLLPKLEKEKIKGKKTKIKSETSTMAISPQILDIILWPVRLVSWVILG